MGSIRAVEDLTPERQVTTYQGIMVQVAGVLAVNVNGNVLPARWADPLVVAEGDVVLVEVSSGRAGQGAALVRSRRTDKPRPGTGTVATVPPSSPTITVTGSDGLTYTAPFVASYTPVVGDPVLLAWNASVPSVQGKISVTTTPAPPPPPAVTVPPPTVTTGQNTYQATQSDTWWGPGGWGSWAGGASRLYQGDYGSGPLTGAYFYAGSAGQLSGKTITRLRFRLGARRPVGSSNSPVTVHVYVHGSASRPGGNVSLVSGPYDIIVQPGQGLKDYDLPLGAAAGLQAGGGLAITGDPYAGFEGRNQHPESGLLIMDWSS